MHELKASPISDSQFVKLLTMCDFLFEGYTFFGKDVKAENLFYIIYKQNNTGKQDAISWFEICMIDIPVRLSEKTGKAVESIIEPWFYSQTDHLVDYLFNIYKNVKKITVEV